MKELTQDMAHSKDISVPNIIIVTLMVAIIIIAKELNSMITSNPHTQGFSLSPVEQVKLKVSPFSGELTPTWFLLPSLFHFGAIPSRVVDP